MNTFVNASPDSLIGQISVNGHVGMCHVVDLSRVRSVKWCKCHVTDVTCDKAKV